MAEAGSIEIPVNVRFQMQDAWVEGYGQGRDDEANGEPLRTGPPQRVVLVKPGDLLLIGNVGELAPEGFDLPRTLKEQLGLDVVLFPADIDIAALPSDGNEGG